jgi:excisionase family DNA binding protein
MEKQILVQLQELKNLTLLGAKQVLTMGDAALLMGMSKSHLYKMVCSKKVPYYKSPGGKLTYFDKGELTSWMLSHRVKTADEVEQEAVAHVVIGQAKKGGVK